MVRYFIRAGDMHTNEPWVDDELLTEKEANVLLAREGKRDLFELVPIKTDVRQVKQEVIV